MPVTEVPAEPPVPCQVDPEPTAELEPTSFLICEKCEKDYAKWSKTSDQYSEWEDDEDSYTDERIV